MLLPQIVLLLPGLHGLVVLALFSSNLSQLVGQVVLLGRQVGQLRQRIAQRERKRGGRGVLERKEGGREDLVLGRLEGWRGIRWGGHLGEEGIQEGRVFGSKLQWLEDGRGDQSVLNQAVYSGGYIRGGSVHTQIEGKRKLAYL